VSTLNLSLYDPMVKDHYSGEGVANAAFQGNAALGMIKKSRKRPGGGKKWIQPIQYGMPGGGSSTFSVAITNAVANTSDFEAFEVTRKKHYRLAKVDNETIEATADGNIDAFEPAFDEFDRGLEAEGNWINFRFFRDSGGSFARSTTATNVATAVMTVDDRSGLWAIKPGDVVKLSPNQDGTSLRTGSLTVLSVQRTAGTITFTGNITAGVAAAVNTDFVFLDGDATLAPSGLADWIPSTAPTSTAYYGVNRSLEPEMLGGVRVDGTDGRSVFELMIDMLSEAGNFGAKPNTWWMHPITFGQAAKQLEGKWMINQAAGYDGKKMASIGYSGYSINIDGVEGTVYTDRMMPLNRIYALTWDTWVMFSAGPAPNFLQKRAGSIIKVSEGSDDYEARIGCYMNFSCKWPGGNVVGLKNA